VCMHGEEPGCKDVNRIFTHQKFKALRELSRNQVLKQSQNPSPKAVPVDYAVLSPEEGTTGSDTAGMTVVSPMVTKAGTDASH
ncbi:hypothetical protein HAX54_045603, partial [Datura stramonium]|nr:hypothetical protein [Datura stramonium]